ncbi:protein tyrosine phosphatase family protein [Halarcobacter anaerophilus]|jgi:protein tyrosine phosphatase (PTP) superfamily phosphohydrolase (DUF442 family)|uniref:protein tyrosine phosphatase family protein n=1 Tax=Halarcobacter anaerophilus TaxID=877500 RepID=UPI0005C840BE|nr:protein tyrosine phosphatase family protein [Halarcobacter anaerophilus]
MEKILNYIKINENISTSGQPTEKEFEKIKDAGFEVVINLALYNASNAIKNEDKTVTSLGMSYFHIPVDFEEPKVEQASLFLNTLKALDKRRVWIHCALNYRATAFMYLFHKHVLNTPFDNIDLKVFDEWTPSTQWQQLMKSSFEELNLL